MIGPRGLLRSSLLAGVAARLGGGLGATRALIVATRTLIAFRLAAGAGPCPFAVDAAGAGGFGRAGLILVPLPGGGLLTDFRGGFLLGIGTLLAGSARLGALLLATRRALGLAIAPPRSASP